MSDTQQPEHPPGLERRIEILKDRRNEGSDLAGADYLVLVAGCIVLPALLILWGSAP